jgi:hypothetical protein
MHPFKYEIKLRPFFTEFIQSVICKYQIFFYTAGIRNYGRLILEVLKNFITKNLDSTLQNEVEITFRPERLIARDDNSRFMTQND